jgi:hypothetical protein
VEGFPGRRFRADRAQGGEYVLEPTRAWAWRFRRMSSTTCARAMASWDATPPTPN